LPELAADAGHPVLDALIADYKASASRRRSKGEDEVRRYLEAAALEPTEDLAHERTAALEEEAAERYDEARRVRVPAWNLVARLRAGRTVRRLANDLSAAHHADRIYWLVHRNQRMAVRGRERAAQNAALAGHTAQWDGDTRTLSCFCGDHAGYLAHVAVLLGTDESGARAALLTVHDNIEINPGMCGGCETCGGDSAAFHCLVCGESDHSCLTSSVAAGHGPTDEGQR
jgi:uncharacterized protein (DUF433 family)